MRNLSRRIWWGVAGLVAADLILITLHLLWGETISSINLEEEQNFATWYSSTKLLLIGLLAFVAYAIEDPDLAVGLNFKYRRLWLVIGGIFVGLSMDEVATTHERLSRALMSSGFGDRIREIVLGGDSAKDAFVWVVFLSPVLIASVILFVLFFYNRLRDRIGLYFMIVAGCLAFALSPILEATIYFMPPLARWQEAEIERYLLLASIEESAELVGSTLFLATLALFIRFLLQSRRNWGEVAGEHSSAQSD